jgi:hypothetical protein
VGVCGALRMLAEVESVEVGFAAYEQESLFVWTGEVDAGDLVEAIVRGVGLPLCVGVNLEELEVDLVVACRPSGEW